MTEVIDQIKENISSQMKLTQADKSVIDEILCEEMNLDRAKVVSDMILKMKLDKNSVIAFLTYQLFKVNEEKANQIEAKLNDDCKEMIETYKVIKDINQLTLSEEIEDIKRMFIAMSLSLIHI